MDSFQSSRMVPLVSHILIGLPVVHPQVCQPKRGDIWLLLIIPFVLMAHCFNGPTGRMSSPREQEMIRQELLHYTSSINIQEECLLEMGKNLI